MSEVPLYPTQMLTTCQTEGHNPLASPEESESSGVRFFLFFITRKLRVA